jgi:putative transposase
MARGFLFLAAVLDWHSRYVLSWQLSNTLEGLLPASLSRWCRGPLRDSIFQSWAAEVKNYRRPFIGRPLHPGV